MYRHIEDKWIDLTPFPKRVLNGREVISWKSACGCETTFCYDGKHHTLKVLQYINRKKILIQIDNTFTKYVPPKSIHTVAFAHELTETKFKYAVGQSLNGLKIIQAFRKNSNSTSKYTRPAYVCKCLVDGYEFEIFEYRLAAGQGCPVCSHNVVMCGVNDIATTDPWMIEYLADKTDATKYSRKSNKKILTECPFCRTRQLSLISDLSRRGFSCKKCSDGISYPNKFAHCLFEQLSAQYAEYVKEYSPNWLAGKRFDNYVLMNDGTSLIVEMDGAFHYKGDHNSNDNEKDRLAFEHNHVVIRIDCNYNCLENRFEHIKAMSIKALSPYFDLSVVNWEQCGLAAVGSRIKNVVEYYNQSDNFSIAECAARFGMCKDVVRNYLKIGARLSICDYEVGKLNNGEHMWLGKTKPIAMYDALGCYINVYPSVASLCENYGFDTNTVRETVAGRKRQYRGYNFKYVSKEQYLKLCSDN